MYQVRVPPVVRASWIENNFSSLSWIVLNYVRVCVCVLRGVCFYLLVDRGQETPLVGPDLRRILLQFNVCFPSHRWNHGWHWLHKQMQTFQFPLTGLIRWNSSTPSFNMIYQISSWCTKLMGSDARFPSAICPEEWANECVWVCMSEGTRG